MASQNAAVWRMAASVSIATGAYGISFGALASAAGLNLWQVMALSGLMFTGGSQFAFVGALAGGGLAAAGTAVLVGLRNAIYGMLVGSWFHPRGLLKLAMAQMTIDESVAVAGAQPDESRRRLGFWAAGVGVYVLWNVMSLVGALLGDLVGDPKVWGLDGAAIAAFCGLLWPRLKHRDAVATAVVAGVATIALVPWVPSGLPIMGAVIVGGAAAWLQYQRRSS